MPDAHTRSISQALYFVLCTYMKGMKGSRTIFYMVALDDRKG